MLSMTRGQSHPVEPSHVLGDFIASRGCVATLKRGEMLFCQGDESSMVYACVRGRVNLYVTSPSGRELIVGAKVPVQGFGELSCIDGAPRSASAVAMQKTEIVKLSGSDFLEGLEQAPLVAMAVLRELSAHLRRINGRLSARSAEGTLERVGSLLIDLTALFERHGPSKDVISLPITQDEVAAWVGCTREAAARSLGVLRDVGVVATSRGKIIILDPVGLRDEIRRAASE